MACKVLHLWDKKKKLNSAFISLNTLNCSKLLPSIGATLDTPSGTSFHYLGIPWWRNPFSILTALDLVISAAEREGNSDILRWTQQLLVTRQPFFELCCTLRVTLPHNIWGRVATPRSHEVRARKSESKVILGNGLLK